MDQQVATRKVGILPPMDEKAYAQMRFDEALATMLKSPTVENIQTFTEANRHLYEVQDAYRIGMRLLIEYHESRMRRKALADAFRDRMVKVYRVGRGIFIRDSQESQSL